ncbi:MAG: hypothetical protein VYE22_25210 [Myxococcota bacterium]|nr:hypothetical protein [Myxococcota bacterium]
MSSRAWTSIRRGWEHLTASLAGQAVPVRRGVSLSGARADRRPSFDVLESEHELLVRCDVPGVRRDALDVCVDGDRLVVTAAPDRLGVIRLPCAVAPRGGFGRLRRGELILELPKARPTAAPVVSGMAL